LIKKFIKTPNPTILEVGCNDGTHTMWFLELFKNPTLYCFEPDPRAISRFKRTVGERPNVKLFEMALSHKNGEITFYQSGGLKNENSVETMPEGWDRSGSIRKPKNHYAAHSWVKFEQAITVPTMTLDTWYGQHNPGTIDLIRMDV
jgi:2-O-methyltransferase